MRRTGRVAILILVIMTCMMGLWLFQYYNEKQVLKKEFKLSNVYVNSVSGSVITGIYEGEEKKWNTASQMKDETLKGIVDLTLVEDKVIHIVKKPDVIIGKVLKISENTITLEEYGEVKTESDFVVYHQNKDGTVTQGEENDINIGFSGVQFVAAGDKICGALIPETEIKNIRVLIKNDKKDSYDMTKVEVTANVNYSVRIDKQEKQYTAGQVITFTKDTLKTKAVISTGGKGKIKINNLKKTQGNPEYRGVLEIENYKNALQIINEVSLEEYLYSVVPSEMPTSYSIEALKAQAVCARSYAVRQMKNKRLAERGAHVDDSVSFQVYNNIREDEKAIEAVNATKGQVVTYKGKVASTYFFSTTAGCTSGTKDVWFSKKDVGYLVSSLQTYPSQTKILTQEKEFQTFIKESPNTLDSACPWYRWQTEISSENLKKSFEKSVKKRYDVNPSQIQVKQEDGSFCSKPIQTVGDILSISVIERGAGGVVTTLEIVGTEATVRVYTEYNIRMLLIGENTVFTRQDKKKATGLSILPSAFFYIEKKGNNYIFSGGGYGHGVGMSQNGANTLANQGKRFDEILTFYFPGTSVQSHESL